MKYKVPIGPIHPALKEPIMITCEVQGEEITGVDVTASQNHRGVEWIGMHRNNPVQSIYLSERICGICNLCHPACLVMAVEEIAGIEVPERAQYIRVIEAELERIHSHLLWAGVAAHELGFDTLLHYTWQVREKVMDILELVNGNRVTKAIMMYGGVRRDITDDLKPKMMEMLTYYRGLFSRMAQLFLEDKTIKMRTRNIGILTKEDAYQLQAVGPTVRASGVPKDVRQDVAYFAYPDFEIKAVTPDQLTGTVVGDTYDRIVVRLLEVKQSLDIIEQALDEMPPGDIASEEKIPKLLAQIKKAEGEAIGRHEAPRGEDIHYVKLKKGLDTLYTWKVRAPTYSNIMAWRPMLMHHQIADIPIVAASIDPCMSCTNRVITAGSSGEAILGAEELHRLSVEKTRRMTP
ncbi:MAG: nickel-dependent hydrogenase large subunit [Candidatus Thermoplasmatota archaeon]|nr:nickel-dependent hydrogenase large subunit [Candidatus Thermoplasmatota archaeon]